MHWFWWVIIGFFLGFGACLFLFRRWIFPLIASWLIGNKGN